MENIIFSIRINTQILIRIPVLTKKLLMSVPLFLLFSRGGGINQPIPILRGPILKALSLAALERPQRYRAYRNLAIIYCLIETGMRRVGICNILLDDIDFEKQTVKTTEKGGNQHKYHISREGLAAIRDYIEHERVQDFEKSQASNLFLSSRPLGGKLMPKIVNKVWAEVCRMAGSEEP